MKLVTPESLCELVMLGDPQIAPDGASVVFVHSAVNRAGNSYTRNIWKAALSPSPREGQGAGVVGPYTASGKDGNPRWSPDGAWLGFISGRGGEAKVFGLPSAGGEAQVLASHKNSISAFEWSPDGSKIAFSASLIAADRNAEDQPKPNPDPSLEEGSEPAPFKDDFASKQDKEKREREEQLRNDPRVVNVFPYRSGTAFFEDRYRHVYVTDAPKNFAEKSDVRPARLTDGELNYNAPYFSADGAWVFSAVTRDPELGNLFRYKDAIQIPINQTDSQTEKFAHTKLAVDGKSCGGVLPSPDGRWLAMLLLGESDPGYNVAWLAVKDLAHPEAIPADLTARLDRNIVEYKWAKDSQHVYFTIESGGRINLWRVGVPGGEVEQLTNEAHDVTAFDVAADGRIVFVAATAHDPSALFVREADGAIYPICQPNKKFGETYALGEIEEFWYASDGFKIQGWLLKPPGFEPSKKYPLALQIHGGPHVQWTGQFPSMMHENQLLAAHGYVVFYCNPRGSDGYGEAFSEANRADWGEGPSRDVLAGVDEVVKRGFVDETRMAITGGSYGGYLTAWIIGHDHRFKAACSQRGVYNLISMRGTTDIPFFNDRESGATPWEDVNKLWDASPLKYAPDIQTPLLIEHSEQDFRVPIEQAEQMFAALRLLKKPVEMVRWPREGHELSRAGEPRHRIERVRRIVEWFDRYCC